MEGQAMTPDLDHLEALAKAATPGPWHDIPHEEFSGSDHRISRVAGTPWGNFGHLATVSAVNAPFIAACSPDVILALVARVRELEVMNHSDRQYLMEKESKLAVRVRVLEEALRKYGCHKWASLNCEAPHEPCICGLAAALTPSEPRDGQAGIG